MSIINYKLLNDHKEIAHFCTTRFGGASVGNYASFNLSKYTGDLQQNIAQNIETLCNLIDIEANKLVVPFQNHGNKIQIIDERFFDLAEDEKESYLHGVDGLVTQGKNICVAVTTADCVPLLFYDPVQKVVAAVHAGWRGTCAKITEKTVQIMTKKFHCEAKNILVTIGPSISDKVYEVGVEVIDTFEKNGFDINQISTKRDNRLFLNLWKANEMVLIENGISKNNIETAGICTFQNNDKFFSARQLGIASGRMLSGIYIK